MEAAVIKARDVNVNRNSYLLSCVLLVNWDQQKSTIGRWPVLAFTFVHAVEEELDVVSFATHFAGWTG